MAAPTVTAGTVKNGTSLSGGVAQNMPATIIAGDLLVSFCAHDTSASVTAGADWTRGFNTLNSSGLIIHAKFAAGGDTLTLTGTANDYVCQVLKIRGHGFRRIEDVFLAMNLASTTGASGNANPPACTNEATRNFLAIAACAIDNTASGDTITAQPAGYTSRTLTKSASSTTSCSLGLATLALTAASSENPGTFTNTSRAWVAVTMLVPPAAMPMAYDFTGTDGDLPAQDVISTGGSASPVKNTNKMRFALPAGGAFAVSGTANFLGLEDVTDFYARAVFTWVSGGGDNDFPQFCWGGDPAGGDFYWMGYITGYGFSAREQNAFVNTEVDSDTSVSLAAGDSYVMELYVVGTQFDGYLWKTTASKPSTPNLTFSDATHGSGPISIKVQNGFSGNATTWDVDDMALWLPTGAQVYGASRAAQRAGRW